MESPALFPHGQIFCRELSFTTVTGAPDALFRVRNKIVRGVPVFCPTGK